MPTAGIPIEQIKNITDNTLNSYMKDVVEDLYLDLTEYVGYRLFSSGQFDENHTGGVYKQWQHVVAGLEHTQAVGAYSQIALSDNNITTFAKQAIRHALTYFIMDMLEDDAQGGGAALVQLVKLKAQVMMESLIKKYEGWVWTCPAENDSLTPLGFPAHVVMYDSTDSAASIAAGGFLGTFPYGGGAEWSTTPSGISPTTYPLAANWAAKYTSPSRDDLVEQMIVAADKTNFQAPTAMMQLIKDMPKDKFTRAVYCDHDAYRGLSKVARAQDGDNKSGDVGIYSDGVQFRGRPVQYVPYLDGVTGSPVYMVNHKSLKFLKNKKRQGWLGGSKEISTEQPTGVVRHHLDTWTMFCPQRKSQAVISTTAKDGS